MINCSSVCPPLLLLLADTVSSAKANTFLQAFSQGWGIFEGNVFLASPASYSADDSISSLSGAQGGLADREHDGFVLKSTSEAGKVAS